MVRTLVLTVDRDDDLGIKAGLRGPIVGRRQVLTAALRLGISDPEESDTNAILGALNQHDMLLEEGEAEDKVEVAIITGDERVGLRSDRVISGQLNEVISDFQPDRAVFVTDGAEDESVLPIIQSRVPIDHIQKVIVKQSKSLEDTFYYVVNAMEDQKMQRKLILPLSGILILLGFGISMGEPILIGMLPLLLGIYLAAKALGFEHITSRVIRDMSENADAAMLSTLMWIGAVSAALFAFVQGWNVYHNPRQIDLEPSLLLIDVFRGALAWIVLSFLLFTVGLIMLKWQKGTMPGRNFVVITFGLVLWSLLDTSLRIAKDVIEGSSYEFTITNVYNDWKWPIFFIALFWVTRMTVSSWRQRTQTGGRYWGV